MFAAGPRAHGFETDRWTTARLARAIEARFSIRYDPDHVGRLMHRLGLRPKSSPAAESLHEVYDGPPAGMEMHT
jgi:transposase